MADNAAARKPKFKIQATLRLRLKYLNPDFRKASKK